MEYLSFVQPKDVVNRVLYRKTFWFHGNPTITLTGNEGEFGKLQFDFVDEKLQWNIYIADREKILDAAHMAIQNFKNLSNEIYEQRH